MEVSLYRSWRLKATWSPQGKEGSDGLLRSCLEGEVVGTLPWLS